MSWCQIQWITIHALMLYLTDKSYESIVPKNSANNWIDLKWQTKTWNYKRTITVQDRLINWL